MAQTTIEQFATDLKMPAGALLEQLTAAGVAGKKQGDNLSEQDKTRLLDYLRKQHGAAGDGKKRITLTRKQTSEIRAADSSGKARTIQVEVRKKRVLVRREEEAQTPAATLEAPSATAPVAVLPPEEIAAREAEARKAQELIARQQEDLQKKQAEAAKRKTKKEREAEEAAARAAAEAKAAEAA
jgi:translation initiation factor IF-2